MPRGADGADDGAKGELVRENIEFTFYCSTHRDHVVKSLFLSARGLVRRHYCPTCYSLLYYVPSGGSVVPDPEPTITRQAEGGAS